MIEFFEKPECAGLYFYNDIKNQPAPFLALPTTLKAGA